jgi:hypothetical protein
MDDAIEGTKELMSETARAFKKGMHGEEYVPGEAGTPQAHIQDELWRLQELRESGTLSEAEFQAARKRLTSGGE